MPGRRRLTHPPSEDAVVTHLQDLLERGMPDFLGEPRRAGEALARERRRSERRGRAGVVEDDHVAWSYSRGAVLPVGAHDVVVVVAVSGR
jgi:hypothetical protein